MSEQHDADSKQPSVQHNEPILVNAQGQAQVSSDASSKTSGISENSSQNNQTQKNRMQKPSSETPPSAPVVTKSGTGKGMAAGALVLSMLALGLSGLLVVEGQYQLKLQQLKFDQKVDAAGIDAGKTQSMLQSSLGRIDTLTSQLQNIQQQQQSQGDHITRLDNAYQQLVKSRTDWLVDEIEATLNLAAQQLIISGNVPIAVSVLEDLDNRLSRFDQPQLLPIKKAISNDLDNLKNRPYLDMASASLRLNRLETAVTSLPLAIDNQLQPGAVPSGSDTDDQNHPKWWQRMWYRSLHALRGMVEIRHIDHNDSMLMSPQQVFFVRENLRLRLMDARLALIQRSSEVYSVDLNSAEATVKQYFDGNSATIQSWLKELNQLKSLNIQTSQDANVLSGSLAAVRQYQKQSGMDMSTALPDLSASAGPAVSASAPAASLDARPASEAVKPKPSNGANTSIQALNGRSAAYANRGGFKV